MLEKDLDIMTWYEFKKMTFRPGEHPNLSKAEMWDQLKEHDVVRTALIRHKSSKDKPGAYIPRIVFAKEHCDICPQRSLDTIRMQFDEEIDIGLAKRYAYSCRGRSMNMDTMKAFYKSMMPASKKGRRTAEQEELMQTYQDLLQKLVDHEKSVAKLLSTKHGRRLRAKRSVEDDDGESSKQDSMFGREYLSMKHSRTISYSYSDKISYTVRARRYAVPDGVQSMSRRLQHHVVDGHTIDLDIQNCCLTLLQQIISKTAPQPPMPVDLVQLMDRLVKDRAGVLKELSLHTVEGKEMINTVLNGGSPPTSLRNNEIVQGLQKISLYVRWVACNLLHADYMSLADNKQKTFPSSTILSLLWTSVEDRILQSWTDHVLTRTTKPKHLSLHFDGIRISADHVGVQQEEFIRDCENAIHKRTGFVVKIVPKKHQNFIQMLKTRGTHANALTNVPDILLMQGNCIPCALWHVVPLSRPAVVAAMSNTSSAKNVDAKSAGYRDYRSVASMCGVDLIGCLGLPGTHVKSFMLHYEGNGVPHSVAVRVDASGVGVTIIDGATVYKLNMATLREIHCAAVDHATILSYWKRDPQDKGGDKSTTLLDMVAGAGDDPNDSDGDDSEGHEEGHPVELANRLSFDDENVPVFKDHILESLEKETNDVSNDLQKKSMRCVRTVSTRCHMAALEDIATAPILVDKMEKMNKVLMDQDESVVHIGTDQPSEKLFSQLKEICPSMRSLLLDPIHLAIVYEYGFWNKRSPGSKQLRRILKKCISIDADLGQDQWGGFYDGTNARPLSEREIQYREMILDASMDQIEANKLLEGLDTNVPFTERLEFIKCIAALCRRHPAEVSCAWEWIRLRHCV
ncbi:hypothetical protein AK812_SmicGene16705 [Symbiodinium microadriaticum]|uniref:Uncharacterized protein n=1 Tax=Symbiodinium microadriaticum TaxID=2951 RepID=A0A1Q9CF10_SYMMI|nr:hypothetical protein AK812_SmicGene37966 [Symbiodinium microadriaticum]OLQ00633.1 hypothetical protein AK812_SmicGene16705 [Symbiodinium microadriaticum]